MTPEEARKLTDEELQIKAGESAGWEEGHLCADDPASVVLCLDREEDVYGCTHLRSGGCWADCSHKASGSPPDYPRDWGAAMELFEKAQRGEGLELYDFCQALESLCDWPEIAFRDAPLPLVHVFSQLTPRFITEAFVLEAED